MDTFTLFHTILSLIWLIAGFLVIAGLLNSRVSNGWVAVFLGAGTLTCVTGFLFKSAFVPSHVIGMVSLVGLLLATLGLYKFQLAGYWRWIFAVSIIVSFWFDAFVTIVQAFRKIPALNSLAPTQSTEPPFTIAQLVLLLAIIWLVYNSTKNFRPAGLRG